MFALYHLNSSYRSCQEWNRWGTKAELKKICVIVWCFLRRQTERRGLFFCFFVFSRLVNRSASQRHQRRSVTRTDGGHRERARRSHQLYLRAPVSQACLHPSCAQIEQSVKWSDVRMGAVFLGSPAGAACWTGGRERKRDIAAVPLSHAKLLQ